MPKSSPATAATSATGTPAVLTHTLWDALGILESCIGVMDARIELLCDGVADAARTLLQVAHASLKVAIEGNTLDLQEDASRCLYEADAVLNLVAREASDAATWGALTLLELCRKMFISIIEAKAVAA